MYEIRVYNQRYNMEYDYYTGVEDIKQRWVSETLCGLIKTWIKYINEFEGDTYSVWNGDELIVGGAYDCDDIDVIYDYFGIEKLTNNFLVTIIDNLEDWLDGKGIHIPNEERDKEDPDNSANFYGNDFDWFMEMMRDVCYEYGIIVKDEWDN